MSSPRRGVELARLVGLGEPLGCLAAAAEDVPIAPALASAARPQEAVTRIWEMTWSFSGPNGRAMFEWVEIDGTSGIRWRRIDTHEISRES